MTQIAERKPEHAPSFVGRERELALLLAGLDHAQRGRGGLFLIGGEPGIGKSRLADEFAARARDRGARVLWGRGWEGAGAPPYWPWIQALRGHLRSVHPDEARAQLGYGAAEVAQMLPEIRALVADLPPPPPDSDSARFQLFDSTATFLHNIARDRLTVLVLEDLQAADTPSIVFLRFLAGQLSDVPLVAVATYRDVELRPDDPLLVAIGEMEREPTTRTLKLGGLGQAEVARLIEAATGQQVRVPAASGLWRGTNGNPLFLAEAVRLLSADGRLQESWSGEHHRIALPAGVRAAIERRIALLDEPTLRALTCGAALGPEFSAEVVRRVGRYSGDDLLAVLGDAIRAGVLSRATLGRYRFSHDLIREAVYARTSESDRAQLHRRIAETLDELYAASTDTHLAELAHHYFEAARGALGDSGLGDMGTVVARAQSYAKAAGDAAARSLAYEEADRLYRMALEALDVARPTDAIERAEILLALGDVQARAGDLPRALPTFREAAAVARRAGAAQQFARAVVGYGGRFLWARAGKDPEVIPMLEDALAVLGDRDERLRVQLKSRLAGALRASPEFFSRSAALSQEAVDGARRLDDPSTLGLALAGRFWAIYWPDTTVERYALANELLDVAEMTGDTERVIDAHMMLSFVHADTGQMVEAKAEIETLTRLAEELRQPAQLWVARAIRCSYALLEGDYDLAGQLIEVETSPGLPSTPVRDDVSAATMHRFLLARERGSLEQEEAAVRKAVMEFPWYPVHRSALACLLLDLGRHEEARSVFEELAEREFQALIKDNEWLVAASLAAEAAAELGAADAAAALYAQMVPFAGLHAIAHGEGGVGIVDRYLGLLAFAVGNYGEAERHLTTAIQLNADMGAVPWRAHTEHDLARVLRRRAAPGDDARADELERAALGAARRLGMTVLEQKLLERDSVRQAADDATPFQPHTGLLHKEGEYWTIGFGAERFRLRDAKGVHYLARLLGEPGREFLALDLAREEDDSSAPGSDGGLGELGTDRQLAGTSPGPGLDDHAKSEYRTRLHELQEELDEADAWHDAERAERARAEMDFLARELGRAVGLGGRDRTGGSATERARLSVTRAIRLVMKRISANNRPLGDHLETSIHTGTYCAYRPDPGLSVHWDIR